MRTIAVFWSLLVGSLPASASPCDEALLAKVDALPDGPLSEVIPPMEAALRSCKDLPPDLARALDSAMHALKDTAEPLPYDTAINAKLGKLHPDWWDALCQPDEAHVLSKLVAYKQRVGTPTQQGSTYVNCEFGRLGLLSEDQFVRAKGLPIFSMYLAQWLRHGGHPESRVLHVVRAFSELAPAPAPVAVPALPNGVPPPPGGEGGVLGGVIGGVAEGTNRRSPSADGVEPFSDGMTRPGYDVNELTRDLYTREARDAHVQGLMMVKCSVLVDGTVKNCRMIKPLQFLSDAVLDRLSRMKMKPATFEGKPVAVDYLFTFTLKPPPAREQKK